MPHLGRAFTSGGAGRRLWQNDVRGLETQLTATLDEMRADGTLAAIIGKYLANPEKFLEVDGLVE